MKDKITLEESIVLWVKSHENKVALPKSDLLIFLYNIRNSKKYDNFEISRVRKDANIKTLFENAVNFLEESKLIENTKYDYFILLSEKDITPLGLACSFYSHGYISYLSAMEYYKITRKIAKSIDFVIPDRESWKILEINRISTMGVISEGIDPKCLCISYPSIKTKFQRRKLNIHSRKNLFPSIQNKDSVRVIEIGCLFLEMIRNPESCGGFDEVLEAFINFGPKYYEEIISAANDYGTKLDKSKIGFLLEEFLNINHSTFAEWQETSVMRGGSRKMLSSAAYSNNYSEAWCISLNHPKFIDISNSLES
jgi:predicted transcriptional regulator of viral defense system